MSQGRYARSDASAAGAALASVREELNLTIDDVARHLKLTPAQVEALEEGAYERLPGRVFVRGFLRNYAKLLGLDPQPLLRRIEHEMPQPSQVDEPAPAPEAIMPTGEPSRMPVYAGVAAIIIAALAVYEFGFNSPPVDPEETSQGTTPRPAPVPPTPAAPAGAPAASVPAATATATTAGSADSSLAPGTPITNGTVTGAALDRTLPPLSTDAPSRSPAAGEQTLRFQFEQESWVEIRDKDDKIIFSKLNKVGSEEQVSGTPPFKLVVGNARGVRVTHNGKPVDLTPHIGVTVARLTLQ